MCGIVPTAVRRAVAPIFALLIAASAPPGGPEGYYVSMRIWTGVILPSGKIGSSEKVLGHGKSG